MSESLLLSHRTFVGARETLITRANATTSAGTARFLVPLLPWASRAKVRLYWENDSGGSPVGTARDNVGAATLWAALVQKGRQNGQHVPTLNLVGTRAAPLTVFSSTDLGLWGYEFSVETIGDDTEHTTDAQIHGTLVFTPTGAAPANAGRWTLEVLYQTVDRISEHEWQRFRSRLRPHVERADITT